MPCRSSSPRPTSPAATWPAWVPQLAANVDKLAAGSLYARVVAAVRDFVAADHDWQLGTIVESP